MKRSSLLVAILLLCAMPAFAQQTGSVSGTVKDPNNERLPGVTVEASGDVLPRARTTVTSAAGTYRLPSLPPGNYKLTFTLSGMDTVSIDLRVLLQKNTTVDAVMQLEGVTETISVTSELLIDTTSAALKTAIAAEVIEMLPVGQEYRDIIKLIPGVQYTEDSVRGPSAGGSGQDNVYQFDGVNVSLPLFGTLATEPSSHDIAQVAIVKGGATAEDFNRSGGFTINTVSKSGTNSLKGMVSYQVQTDGMTGNLDTGSLLEFDEDRDWTVFNLGGPAVADNLFFYASYYRPTRNRANVSNAYGAVPDFDDERDEFFGKLTFTPADNFLLNASYKTSDRQQSGIGVGTFETASRSEGGDFTQDIAILDASWVLSDTSLFSFTYTDNDNETSAGPDSLFDFPINASGPGGTALDVANLDQQGSFGVPTAARCGGDAACLAAVADLISRYGYTDNGVLTGGGFVGGASTINIQDFFRESYQLGYDREFGSGNVSHEVHFGYQAYEDSEDLNRSSNGWGVISFLGGLPSDGPEGSFYEVLIQQAGTQGFPSGIIKSSYESQNFEINDTVRWNNWTLNLGVLVSNDELFGQGLKENSSNVSGFELSPGSKYKMYEIPFEDMIQPRLGVVWNYDENSSTVFANFARYNPAANSLPRAASWARNTRGQRLQVFFDAAGNQISSQQLGGSSGKFFQPDMTPRVVDEYLVGTARQFGSKWTGRAHARYRKADHFWEDTNNNARSRLLAPANYPQGDYIPQLGDYRAEIGGSSYVIADLDFAFSKYYEASFEAEYRSSDAYFRGSYVWSHYYGSFDQDNTSSGTNDFATFIGSSNIADFAGRQVWNNHYGDLRGDRRHQLKAYGSYNLDWNASVGAYAIYQSGQPWEILNPDYYRCLDPVAADRDANCRVGGTGSSSASYRFGSCLDPANGGDGTGVCPYPSEEHAGNRTTSDHWQVDVAYAQDIPL
ncbi:MAG: TonB-dependent receptor, partial [Thermoanaerobaculia bacterium]